MISPKEAYRIIGGGDVEFVNFNECGDDKTELLLIETALQEGR